MTEIKENASALEALDFAIVCEVVTLRGACGVYEKVSNCNKTAKYIATLHNFTNCEIVKKPICFDCVKNGTWYLGCDCCNIDNILLDLEPL